jgi:hypothetical protein
MLESIKPLPEGARRVAELLDAGLDYEAIARETGLDLNTVRHRYAQMYRNYIRDAARVFAEAIRAGVDVETVRQKLLERGFTEGMISKAMEEAQKQLQAAQSTPPDTPELTTPEELERLRREGEEARRAIEEQLKRVGISAEGEGVDRELVEKVAMYKRTLQAISRLVGNPSAPPTAVSSAQAQAQVQLAEILEAMSRKISELEQRLQAREYRGMIRKVVRPDGTVEEYDYLPDDKIKITVYSTEAEARRKQVDAVVDKVLPEVLSEVKATRADITRLGERLLSILETYIVPKIHKLHPALESVLPITIRTPEQRERELEELNKKLESKQSESKQKGEEGEEKK